MLRTQELTAAITGLLLMLVSVGTAQALVIDFEDIGVPVGTFSSGSDRISTGFLFDSNGNGSTTLVNGVAGFESDNGTTYLGISDFGAPGGIAGPGTIITMTPEGGGTFDLISIEFTEFENRTTTDLITVTGSGGQVTVIDLDNIADGIGGLNDFQLETFNWSGLSYVTFNRVPLAFNNWWGMDNLVVAVIPEPSSALLLFIGLAALGAKRTSIETPVWRARARPDPPSTNWTTDS